MTQMWLKCFWVSLCIFSADTKNIKILPTNKHLFLWFHLAMLKEHSCFKNSTLEMILNHFSMQIKETVASKQILTWWLKEFHYKSTILSQLITQ